MKQIILKNKMLFLGLVLAAAILLCIPVQKAFAYFSDYQKASGEAVIHLQWDTHLNEEMDGNNKHITIANTGEANAVVRVQIFAADLAKTTPEKSWKQGADDWWYYTGVLSPGKETSELLVEVEGKDLPKEEMQIIAVQESARVVYEEDGTLRVPENWQVPDPWISE